MRKIMSVLLALVILASGGTNVTCGFFGDLAGKAVAIAEETASSGEEAPAPKADVETKPTPEATKAPNAAQINAGPTVTPENSEGSNVTESPSDGDTPTPGPEEDSAEEPTEAPTEEPEEEVVTPPTFSLSGKLDASWLKYWNDGKKDGVRLHYVASTSAFVPEYGAVFIKAFGLKEARALREGETEKDLRHDISSSGRGHTFGLDKLSDDGSYTIPESALRAAGEGSYEVYAVYLAADGQEKLAIFGAITLKKVEKASGRAAGDRSAEATVLRTVELDAWVEGDHTAPVLVLSATLHGFDHDTVERMQWQFNNGEGWTDVAGANGLVYRSAMSAEKAKSQWRLKVIVEGEADAEQPVDAPIAEEASSEE